MILCQVASVSHPGLLQKFFDFYSVYFGITAPPPERQRLMVALLIAFVVVLAAVLFAIAKVVSSI